jgi:hypothetical protein
MGEVGVTGRGRTIEAIYAAVVRDIEIRPAAMNTDMVAVGITVPG